MALRQLSSAERELLKLILGQSTRAAHYLAQIERCLVNQIDEQGSLQFLHGSGKFGPRPHRFIDVKGIYLDADGIPVLLCPFEDSDGNLYMFDIQKMGGGEILSSIEYCKVRVDRG